MASHLSSHVPGTLRRLARRLPLQSSFDGRTLTNRRRPDPVAPLTWSLGMFKRDNLRPANLRWGIIAALLGLPLPII